MKKNVYFLFFIALFVHFQSVAQTQTIKSIQAQTIELSKQKFQDPLSAKSSFLQILSNNPHLPDSVMYDIFRELAVCNGIMHHFDSAIHYTKSAIALVPANDNPIMLLKTLGNLYSMSNNPTSADSCFKIALQLCDKLNIATYIKVVVLGDYASYFYTINNYATSLKLLTEAINLNQSVAKIDSNRAILLREKMADIYLETHQYHFAEKLYLANIDFLQSKGQNLPLANNYTALAETYQGKKNFTLSNDYFSKALTIYTQLNNETYQHYCLMNLAENQLLNNQAAQAEPLIKKAFDGMRASNSIYLIEAAPIYLRIVYATHNTQIARAIMLDEQLQKALVSNYSEDALNYYNATLPFLSTDGNELNNTLKKIIVVGDSVHNEAKRKDILEIEAKYQLAINEEKEALLLAQNKILLQDNRLKKNQLLVYLLLGGIIVLVLLQLLKKYRENLKANIKVLNFTISKNEALAIKAEKETAENVEKQAIIEEQKKELLHYIHQVQHLETEILSATEKNLVEEKNNLTTELNKLKEGKQQLEIFMAKFNAIYPSFCTSLVSNHPKLSNSDVLFCSLTKMNLTPKDIASIMNIEQLSVYKRKYRIAEKIGLSDIEKFNEIIFAIR